MSSEKPGAGRSVGVVQGLTLLFPVTLSVMGALLVAPVIPQMTQAFATTPGIEFLAPLVVTIPGLCIAVFSPFAGMLGDALGRRRLLIWSMLVYTAFGVAPFFLRDLWVVIGTRVVVGVMEAVVLTLSTTLIADHFLGATRDRWLAAQTGLASISAVVFLMLGGAAGRIGWHGPFLIYLFPLILTAAVVAFTWDPSPNDQPDAPSRNASWAGFPVLFMLGVGLVTVFASVIFYTVQIQLSTALAALGVTDPAKIGALTGAATLGVPLGTVVFWLLSPRLALRPMLMLEFALTGSGFLLMSATRSEATFTAAAALAMLGGGIMLPTLLTWCTSGLPLSVRARGIGVWQSAFALGQFLSGLLVPLLAKSAGGVLPAFQQIGVLCIGAAAITLLMFVIVPARPTPA